MKLLRPQIFLVVGLLTTLAIRSFIFSSVKAQNSETETPVPSPTQTSIPLLPTSIPAEVTDKQMLAVYKEVLEASKNSIEEVHKTADRVLNLVQILFIGLTVGLTASGLGAAWLFNKALDRAAERIARVYEEAKQVSARVDSIVQKAQILEILNQEAELRAEELKQLQDEVMNDLDSSRNELKTLQQEMGQTKKGVERDLSVVKRALEVFQVEEYGMNTFSEDASQRQKAIMSLIEMSKRPNAIIRRRCVRIFGALEEFDQAVTDRLTVMTETDPARGVRKEAEEALRRLKGRKPPRYAENVE